MAQADGVETGVLCLTAGAAGSYRPDNLSNEELAQRRKAEFAAACESLGVLRHEILDYADGELRHEDFGELTGLVIGYIRRWKPHVIVTFGADGGVNLHRDHTTVSLAVTAAFHWAGRSGFYPEQLVGGLAAWAPQKLYYSSPVFNSSRDEEAMAVYARVPFSLTLPLGAWLERKVEAFAKHETQRAILERVEEEHRARSRPEHEVDGAADPAAHPMAEERYLLAAARTSVVPDETLFTGVIHE